MDEGCKPVIAIMAAILASLLMQAADDLVAASVQRAEAIMREIDSDCLTRD